MTEFVFEWVRKIVAKEEITCNLVWSFKSIASNSQFNPFPHNDTF